MRKRGIGAGGCLFVVGLVALILYFGIFRLATGHLPEHLEYMVWGYIAVSMFGEAYIEIQNTIEKSTTEIKDEIKRLEKKIEEIVK